MTTDNTNIVTIDIDLNTLISNSSRTDALQKIISDRLRNTSEINNMAVQLIKDYLSDAVIKELSNQIEKRVKATYGTDEAIQKMVDSNSYGVQNQIREIMSNKTEILEKSIMKAMLADSFQESIAKQVSTLIKDRVVKSITHVDYPHNEDDDEDY